MEKIGPRESRLTANNVSKNRGEITTSIAAETMMSNARFAISCSERAERLVSEGVITRSFSKAERQRPSYDFHNLSTTGAHCGMPRNPVSSASILLIRVKLCDLKGQDRGSNGGTL
jgi:hypothetical protein